MPRSLHTPEYEHFLAELREARERSGLTQEQLAERLGEHQTLISKVERGIRRLDIIELRRWLGALNSSLAKFVPKLEERLARHTRVASQ